MSGARKSKISEVTVGGKRLEVSNLDKVLYPETAFTKGQMIEYYIRVSEMLLPHLKNRPLTLKRYPDGVNEEYFYEKECPSYHPEWVQTIPVKSDRRKFVNFCVVNDLPSLVWVVNLASLGLHTSLSLGKDELQPTMMIFDLDPGPPAGLEQCVRVALEFRKMLSDLKLESFAKTSGGKGLHLNVPLNTKTDYEQTKSFAQAFARMLAKRLPEEVTANMRKDLRHGKVFVDWSQNDDHKTTVSVYSLRARSRPTVSAPVKWETLERCHRKMTFPG